MTSSRKAKKLSYNPWIDDLLNTIENSIFDSFDVARPSNSLRIEDDEYSVKDEDKIGETDYEFLAQDIRDLKRKRGYDSGAD